ncbi:MAG: hypothetical protein QGH74_08215 [Candidatus Brocadiia bacterium]|nr:hypothetical protein [Candidatus Brocadiia bacterium]
MRKCFGILLVIFFLTGCATPGTVICFAPAKPFEPSSGRELLAAFNEDVNLDVSPKRFLCKAKSKGLVGWVAVRDTKKDVVKTRLRESPRLRLLQVEALDPQFSRIIKKRWRQSQDVRPPNKREGVNAARQ